MIVERCKNLEAKFAASYRTYKLDTQLSRVQQETERVRALRQQAETAAAILSTLSSRATDPLTMAGIEEGVRIAEVYPRLAILWARLKNDQDVLGGRDLGVYKEAYHATANTCSGLRSAAERTWHDHASRRIPNDDAVLDVFERSNPRIVADLRRFAGELLKLHNVTSPSRAEMEQFDRIVAAYRVAFQSLGGDIPKNVRKALQATASGGASLDLFSADVVAWLRKRGVVKSFRVVARFTP